MIIRFGDLESDQAALKGELGIDIFQIESSGDIRSIGPVACDFHTTISGEHLILDGNLSIPCQLRCVGCLEDFSYFRDISDYHAEIKIDDFTQLDLTEHIRDDILLEIPTYPHCTDGIHIEHTCPMKGPFSFESKGTKPLSDSSEEEQPPDIWAALDDLDSKDD